MQRAHVGVSLRDLETKEEVYNFHGEKYFFGSSLQKIPLSFCALDLLKAPFEFTTHLLQEGYLTCEGVLKGNLWLKAGGDPTLTTEHLREWIQQLKSMGLSRIEGKVLIDLSHFEKARASAYWCFEDIANYYGSGAHSLSLNENLYEITFKPGLKVGKPATVLQLDPPVPQLSFYNEVVTGEPGSGDQAFVFGCEYHHEHHYRGTIPLEAPSFTIKGALPDPAILASELFQQAFLPTEKVHLGREFKPQAPLEPLLCHRSKNLSQLLAEMNTYSHNLIAEHLFKAIGQGSAQRAIQRLSTHLHQAGLVCQIQDGAGLARGNLWTPSSFNKLLERMFHDPYYQPFLHSLPSPGKGTLLHFPSIESATLLAKTGKSRNTYALAGYLQGAKKLSFALFFNHCDISHIQLEKTARDFLLKILKSEYAM
jgi:D-alanyl-D-alanine carboxypeptidase/D-alanyl-D-alanine-endopeptidase (penicillin-binding protein 4)